MFGTCTHVTARDAHVSTPVGGGAGAKAEACGGVDAVEHHGRGQGQEGLPSLSHLVLASPDVALEGEGFLARVL